MRWTLSCWWEEVYFYLHVGICIPDQSHFPVRSGEDKECWIHTGGPDGAMSGRHHVAGYVWEWLLRYYSQTVRHKLILKLQNHGRICGLVSSKGSFAQPRRCTTYFKRLVRPFPCCFVTNGPKQQFVMELTFRTRHFNMTRMATGWLRSLKVAMGRAAVTD